MSEQEVVDQQQADTQQDDAVNDQEAKDIESKSNVDVDAGEKEKVADDKPAGAWFDNLPPDMKNDPDVTKYKSLDEYVKGNREVRKMIGKDKVAIPNDKSTPEEWAEFYGKIGRPAELSGYAVPKLDIPDEIRMADAELEAFKAKAHKLGLTSHQFAELYGMRAELTQTKMNQELEANKKIKEKTETELRGEWGNAYEAKVDSAQKVINTFFTGKAMHKAFPVLANDAGFVKAMAEVAEKLGEDAIGGKPRSTLTPTEAQKELDSILGGSHDLSKAYFGDDFNPEHKIAVDRVVTLQQLISGGQK